MSTVGLTMPTHCGALAAATGALWPATDAALITMHWGALASPTVIRPFGVVKSKQYAGALYAATGALSSATTSTDGALYAPTGWGALAAETGAAAGALSAASVIAPGVQPASAIVKPATRTTPTSTGIRLPSFIA
jgi:hypothetical protein